MAHQDPEWPAGLAVAQVRFARPTSQLAGIVDFYSGCLGLPEIGRFSGHAGYDGVMLGLPGTGCHLEFTSHASATPPPTAENLLVLYFTGAAGMSEAVDRLRTAGHRPIALANPYWAEHGAVAFADPDGWPVVLVPEPVF